MTNNNNSGKLNYKASTLYDILMLHGFKHDDAVTYIRNSDKMCGEMEEIGSLIHDFNGGVTQGGNTGE